VAAVLVVVIATSATVTALALRDRDRADSVKTVDTTAPSGPQRFRASATVLQNAHHGPELCLGGVLSSLPPQCSGPPITNWSWEEVTGEERQNGVIWGAYGVVGTYDGKSFTLTAKPGPRTGRPSDEVPGADRFASPCPTPPGGWKVVDPSKMSFADEQAVDAAAGADPDFVLAWVDARGTRDPKHPERPDDPAKVVKNFAFTGDLERHEAELRALWGGPMCVSRKLHSSQELQRIQKEVQDDPTIHQLWSSAGNIDDVVEVGVVWDDGTLQRRLDERYGPGVVKVTSALQPIN
jgi:hypothetical protein